MKFALLFNIFAMLVNLYGAAIYHNVINGFFAGTTAMTVAFCIWALRNPNRTF